MPAGRHGGASCFGLLARQAQPFSLQLQEHFNGVDQFLVNRTARHNADSVFWLNFMRKYDLLAFHQLGFLGRRYGRRVLNYPLRRMLCISVGFLIAKVMARSRRTLAILDAKRSKLAE
jgi:hypothetical protein